MTTTTARTARLYRAVYAHTATLAATAVVLLASTAVGAALTLS